MEVTLSGKSQWSGIVKIDDSLDDYVTDIDDAQESKRLIIKDVKYHHTNYLTPDVPPNFSVYGFPTQVVIWIKQNSELQDYMKCDALLGYYKEAKTRGFIRKETYYVERLEAKGFRLEPTDIHEGKIPVLGSYRANIGSDNNIDIEQIGLVCFCSSSQSSMSDAAWKSLTYVFVASDEKPFVAYVRKKGTINKVICNSDGITEISQDRGQKESKKKQRIKPNDDPLTVLKLRLAKGEITKEEYEELKKTLES
jgi:hypothetical protein